MWIESSEFGQVIRSIKNLYVMGSHTCNKLWKGYVEKQLFNIYFIVVQRGLQSQNAYIFVNASNKLKCSETCPTGNIRLVKELICIYPDTFIEDCSFRGKKNEESLLCTPTHYT